MCICLCSVLHVAVFVDKVCTEIENIFNFVPSILFQCVSLVNQRAQCKIIRSLLSCCKRNPDELRLQILCCILKCRDTIISEAQSPDVADSKHLKVCDRLPGTNGKMSNVQDADKQKTGLPKKSFAEDIIPELLKDATDTSVKDSKIWLEILQGISGLLQRHQFQRSSSHERSYSETIPDLSIIAEIGRVVCDGLAIQLQPSKAIDSMMLTGIAENINSSVHTLTNTTTKSAGFSMPFSAFVDFLSHIINTWTQGLLFTDVKQEKLTSIFLEILPCLQLLCSSIHSNNDERLKISSMILDLNKFLRQFSNECLQFESHDVHFVPVKGIHITTEINAWYNLDDALRRIQEGLPGYEGEMCSRACTTRMC